MKPVFKKLAAVACAIGCALSISACGKSGGTGKSTLLGAPEKAQPLSYNEYTDEGLKAFRQSAENFAAQFAAEAYGGESFAVSPVSVYMALSMAAECANGQTRNEILSALGVSYDSLSNGFSKFYRSLNREYTAPLSNGKEKVAAMLKLSNSVWVNEGTSVKQNCIDALAEKYFAYSYSAPFYNDNVQANLSVREFIKEQTKGLIDKDFNLKRETVFSLINTLYLKEIWNSYGDDLSLTGDAYGFTAKDGTVTRKRFLQGYYESGRKYVGDKFTSFFAGTAHGFKIKFIVPADGYGIEEVFTQETIAQVNAVSDYNAYGENFIHYSTRCIFPEFETSYDEDVSQILKNKFNIETLFSDGCDVSNLYEYPARCSAVRHVTQLKVDKKGIEGAAVTVIAVDNTGAPGIEVFEDFLVDRAFGFIITDSFGTTVFSGVIDKI